MSGGSGDMESRTAARRGRLAVKRLLDVVIAALALVVLLPLLVGIACAVKCSDGGPVLYRQERVGRYGRAFRMIKFRTMVVDADQQIEGMQVRNLRSGPLYKAADDPRVTRIGRSLRRTGLDELPQLLNVLGGTMSMVGPRPALFSERSQFPPDLLVREELPQGITGLWQLEGRRNPDFGVYRALDVEYVRDWSLRRDLALLIRTPFVLAAHSLRPEVDGAGDPPESGTPRPVPARPEPARLESVTG
jgi:lipopolysaccharide/colanic/teichoic acid biosynthesis glycosyltransferase